MSSAWVAIRTRWSMDIRASPVRFSIIIFVLEKMNYLDIQRWYRWWTPRALHLPNLSEHGQVAFAYTMSNQPTVVRLTNRSRIGIVSTSSFFQMFNIFDSQPGRETSRLLAAIVACQSLSLSSLTALGTVDGRSMPAMMRIGNWKMKARVSSARYHWSDRGYKSCDMYEPVESTCVSG